MRGSAARFYEDPPAAGHSIYSMCHFKAADLLLQRSGECTALIAEQFAFDKARGDCRAVQADEREISPRTHPVERAGYQFFPRAGFTHDQHGGIAWRNDFNQTLACIDRLSTLSGLESILAGLEQGHWAKESCAAARDAWERHIEEHRCYISEALSPLRRRPVSSGRASLLGIVRGNN